MFLDAHRQFSNGKLNDYLREAKCLPINCRVHRWNYRVMFEESHIDYNFGSSPGDPPENYLLNF